LILYFGLHVIQNITFLLVISVAGCPLSLQTSFLCADGEAAVHA
jgi:hypothetical protein